MSLDAEQKPDQGGDPQAPPSRFSIPVAVVLERTIDDSSKWGLPGWALVKVISGRNLKQNDQKVIIHEEAGLQRLLYSGLRLDLFKDGGEGYWYNLLSSEPYLFVVCEGQPNDMEINPFYVTVNQDEANGFLETEGGVVLSSPMPVGLRDLLEHYVVEYYHPKQRKKRKRTDWLEDSAYVEKARNDGAK